MSTTDALSLRVPTDALTPPQLAELFWAMDATQQAQFFNHLGVCVLATMTPYTKQLNSWQPLEIQMQEAASDKLLLDIGREAMTRIGETAQWIKHNAA